MAAERARQISQGRVRQVSAVTSRALQNKGSSTAPPSRKLCCARSEFKLGPFAAVRVIVFILFDACVRFRGFYRTKDF